MRRGMRNICVVVGCLVAAGCGDFQDRLQGYPKQDTVINLEIASPHQIADALSQMTRVAVAGDDWQFPDPADTCTVHVRSKDSKDQLQLDLRNAQFALHRDPHSQRYYATMQNGSHTVQNALQQPLRLAEASTYHDVFFAEGYLQALAQKCQQHRMLQARAATPAKS